MNLPVDGKYTFNLGLATMKDRIIVEENSQIVAGK